MFYWGKIEVMLSSWSQINRADKLLSTSVEWRFILASVLSILTLALSSSPSSSAHSAPVSPTSYTFCFCVLCSLQNIFFSLCHDPPTIYPPNIPHFLPHSCFSACFLFIPLCFCRCHLPACWASEGHFSVRDGGRGWCSYIHPLLRITAGWRRDVLMIRMGIWKERYWKVGERQNSCDLCLHLDEDTLCWCAYLLPSLRLYDCTNACCCHLFLLVVHLHGHCSKCPLLSLMASFFVYTGKVGIPRKHSNYWVAGCNNIRV